MWFRIRLLYLVPKYRLWDVWVYGALDDTEKALRLQNWYMGAWDSTFLDDPRQGTI